MLVVAQALKKISLKTPNNPYEVYIYLNTEIN